QDIPDTFVVQIARGEPEQDSQTFQFKPVPNSQAEPLPRWARHMDMNQDGDISQREFVGTVDQFERGDANGDGFIDRLEIMTLGQ
ncbi:MAG: hypothetical protein MI861_03200, partial [Pirellulales bacterium]|nr:hypothetical protein [Pirellulales bacterium]